MAQYKPILLVEDNPDDADLTVRALKKNHLSNPIVLAEDGVEALDFIFGTGAHKGRDPGDWPQVVLLDLKLPRVDGIQVLERIRGDERTAAMPVVVLTSSDEENDLMRSYSLHANSYVRKPVGFDAFTEAIAQVGLYWAVVNSPPR